MPDNQSTLDQLCAPFPTEAISWRVGSTNSDKNKGMALAYIDARDVMDRLDFVVGCERWQARYPQAQPRAICEIGIKFDNEWIWKADGAGDTDFESDKGALSDAFKRAAVRWGIGRYLYGLNAPWVAIEQRGRSHVIKDYAPLQRVHNQAVRTLGVIGGRRKTIALARHDKDFERLSDEIAKCANTTALDKWWDMRGPDRSIMPASWETDIIDVWEKRRNELVEMTNDGRAAV